MEDNRDLLAALGHEGERALRFLCPVTPDIRMGKVEITGGLDMHGIHELSQLAGPNYVCDCPAVWRVAQYYANVVSPWLTFVADAAHRVPSQI